VPQFVFQDYEKRKIDLAFIEIDWEKKNTQPVTFTLLGGNKSGLAVTGPQKLVQRVILILFTIPGTKLWDPAFGTEFLLDAIQNRWRSTADIRRSFAAARLALLQQLRDMEESSDPDDEIAADVELVNVKLDYGSVSLYLRLTTAAGKNVPFVIPVPIIRIVKNPEELDAPTTNSI